jgi:hypothetical protein
MKSRIEFAHEHYHSMFCLGIETWWPGLFEGRNTWKYFSIGVIIGPHLFSVTVGNEEVYHNTIGKHLTEKEEV